jgi:Fe2+ or Zn2+ uptake regulation protein
MITIMNNMKGTRNTAQRRMIEGFMKNNHNHPTAVEVFEHVRKLMPNMSMATVYRNLAVLAADGKIGRIDTGEKSRFDCNTSWHFHLRCQICGVILDIECQDLTREFFSLPDGYQIIGCNFEIVGICPNCIKAMPKEKLDGYARELLMTIQDNPELSCSQIAFLTGRHPQSVNGKLKSLIESGMVTSPIRGIYKITQKGLQCTKERK